MRLSVTESIAAPPSRVFAVASDFANAAENIAGIKRVEMLTDGPVGFGTRFRETRVVYGREATEEMEVTEWVPDELYGLGCVSHGCRYHSVFRFEPVGEGGETEVEMTFEATPLTFFAKVMSVFMRAAVKGVAKCVEQDLRDIKTVAERSSGD